MYGNRENAPSYNKSCQWFEYKETESFLHVELMSRPRYSINLAQNHNIIV